MAAGDWLSSAGIGDANIAVARRTVQVALNSAIKNKSILGHPWMLDLMARDEALGELLGELGVSVSLATLGSHKLASTAEGTEATPTDFSTSNSATVTPARRAAARDVGDMARALQEPLLRGEIAPDTMALIVYDAMGAWANDIVDQIVATATSASYTIGVTATDLVWSSVNDGVLDLKDRGVQSNVALGLLSVKGAKDLSADMLSLGGAVQFAPEFQGAIANAQSGAFLFRVNGVDWYLNSELDTDGSDTVGCVLTPGSHLLKHKRVPLPGEADMIADLGFLTIEARRPGGGLSRMETVSHNAVGILEQARFAKVIYATS